MAGTEARPTELRQLVGGTKGSSGDGLEDKDTFN